MTPWARALAIAERIPDDELGVIRMPLTPWLTRFSIAETWPSLSPSNAPASAISSAPSSSAASFADSRILTKNGLESVLVIRPILMPDAAPEPDAAGVVEPEQPASAMVAANAAASAPTLSAAARRLIPMRTPLFHFLVPDGHVR